MNGTFPFLFFLTPDSARHLVSHQRDLLFLVISLIFNISHYTLDRMSKTKVRFMATSTNEDIDYLDGLDDHASNANTYRSPKQHMGRELRQRNIPYKYEVTSEQGLEGLDTSYPFTTRAYAERNLLDCCTFQRRAQTQHSSPSNRLDS